MKHVVIFVSALAFAGSIYAQTSTTTPPVPTSPVPTAATTPVITNPTSPLPQTASEVPLSRTPTTVAPPSTGLSDSMNAARRAVTGTDAISGNVTTPGVRTTTPVGNISDTTPPPVVTPRSRGAISADDSLPSRSRILDTQTRNARTRQRVTIPRATRGVQNRGVITNVLPPIP